MRIASAQAEAENKSRIAAQALDGVRGTLDEHRHALGRLAESQGVMHNHIDQSVHNQLVDQSTHQQIINTTPSTWPCS